MGSIKWFIYNRQYVLERPNKFIEFSLCLVPILFKVIESIWCWSALAANGNFDSCLEGTSSPIVSEKQRNRDGSYFYNVQLQLNSMFAEFNTSRKCYYMNTLKILRDDN